MHSRAAGLLKQSTLYSLENLESHGIRPPKILYLEILE